MPNRRSLLGIHTATITIFKDTDKQELDIEANKNHILYLAKSGLHGALILGSTGEQVALTREERIQYIKAACEALRRDKKDKKDHSLAPNPAFGSGDFHNFTVMAGAGGQSIKECVTLTTDAADAGADYAVVLPPSFFASNMTTAAVESFYTEVADKSPIPIIIYSWPGASNGLEVTSDMVKHLAKHPNIVGIKQTDHNVGMMARNVWQTSNEDFFVLAGASDYLIGGLAVGIHGSITGITNIFPCTILALYELFNQGKYDVARELQGRVSAVEWVALKYAMPATKYAMQCYRGYGGIPRRPVPPPSQEAQEEIKTAMSVFDWIEEALVGYFTLKKAPKTKEDLAHFVKKLLAKAQE